MAKNIRFIVRRLLIVPVIMIVIVLQVEDALAEKAIRDIVEAMRGIFLTVKLVLIFVWTAALDTTAYLRVRNRESVISIVQKLTAIALGVAAVRGTACAIICLLSSIKIAPKSL
ncbi:MAG: hypothetical protein JSR85_03610 [Proteobacteria bacterium]|nr:hypothetical protein [Pseudomonadota bacterium]